MSFAVRTESLQFSYGKEEALKGLSFTAPLGKITGVLGPNGSGKSTTFKILSTQLAPDSGDAWVNGFSVKNERQKIRESLGVTFQSPSLDPILTVEENLSIHASLYGLRGSQKKTRIRDLLAVLQITDRKKSRIKTLSGGLARRVELAKTLLSQPKLLLLDEPTTGLDPHLRNEFWAELRRQRDSGLSVLVTTHLMDEAELCDELVFLTEGKLAAKGTPTSLKQEFGADIILVEAPRLSERLASLRSAITGKAELADGKLRIESSDPMKVIDLLRKDLGSEIQNLSWGKPTLGDVYLSRTGKSL